MSDPTDTRTTKARQRPPPYIVQRIGYGLEAIGPFSDYEAAEEWMEQHDDQLHEGGSLFIAYLDDPMLVRVRSP